MPHSGTEGMVSLRLSYNGTTRRVVMSLHEMVPAVLEDNIRAFLRIPADRKVTIERYSDSASSYVLLNSANASVYKQLYRAAKAKSKLKLRVTLLEQEPQSAPKPVSIQEVPDLISTATSAPQDEPSLMVSQSSLPLRPTGPTVKEIDEYMAKAASIVAEREELCKEFENRLSCLMNCQFLNPSPSNPVGDEVKAPVNPSTITATYAVCCNNCNKSIPGVHYHCSNCDDGDFDLCQSCIDQGITCYTDHHWLIKRSIVDGVISTSDTEIISPKQKNQTVKEEPHVAPVYFPKYTPSAPATTPAMPKYSPTRTCNMCLTELAEAQFLHCSTCRDFDLCTTCFLENTHGHHPMHAFVPAVPGSVFPEHVNIKLAPGRDRPHLAICDGCDKNIRGVRHKCLDCPDWDYCADCVANAKLIHPGHRFAPLYEPLAEVHTFASAELMHMGICCDGPLCKRYSGWPSYIRGTRFKCAVCPDLDFCANCEASPANDHNKTHPIIKFKTPVRHVSVTTTGEHQDGRQLPSMGDRSIASPSSSNAVNDVQTVVDVKPEEPPTVQAKEVAQPEMKREEPIVQVDEIPRLVDEVKKEVVEDEELKAVFVRDFIPDGTIIGPDTRFVQTWTLRNEGTVPWPVGCYAKFSGGDYMGHVDPAHPTGIPDLLSASESTFSSSQVMPGQEFQFSVSLRSPPRAGKFISYWRLTNKDGIRFGERLWCEINVRCGKAAPSAPIFDDEKEEEQSKSDESLVHSAMIFPKLEKESPNASIHEEVTNCPATRAASQLSSSPGTPAPKSDLVWDGSDGSDDGFMTDEEYDILDASDEEYLEEQLKKTARQ